MAFPERFKDLPDYAFPRLRALLDPHAPGDEPVVMTIGEPRHAMPAFLAETLNAHLDGFSRYPANGGVAPLREAIGGWVQRRYGVALDPQRQIMALNGTREGLFNAMLALCPERKRGAQPAALIPNPFYQVYAAATMAVGAEPVYVPATAESGFLPDYAALPAELLDRVAVAWICSPANPQGAVASRAYWAELLALAERHDFRIFADECYSEIWRDAPPPGMLEAAAEGGADPERVLVFNSLSKRSNLPGLRSGFVAGGPECIARMLLLRTYGGAPLPPPLQQVSVAVWKDEAHVEANRELYRAKFDVVEEVLGDVPGFRAPDAGFFLWLAVPDGEAAALKLWRDAGVQVLPGSYFAREVDGIDPGKQYIRVALTGPLEEVRTGLTRLRARLYD